MNFVYRKATISDSEKITELFEKMLRAIYHIQDVEGYKKCSPDWDSCSVQFRRI